MQSADAAADLEYVRWRHYSGRAEVILEGLIQAPTAAERQFWQRQADAWLNEVRREPRSPLASSSHSTSQHDAGKRPTGQQAI